LAKELPSSFHLHLISDSTGETLGTIAKSVAVQYPDMRAVEHFYPLVRNERQMERALGEIETSPGIVLYTLVNEDLKNLLEAKCLEMKIPCLHVLDRVLQVFDSFLGARKAPTIGAQHLLDNAYFERMEALNFVMAHDDGCLPENLDDADIIILGISRTSKTPTSIYLANKGYKTSNLPIVPGISIPEVFHEPTTAFIVGLVASADRISKIRRTRVLTMADRDLDDYVDRNIIVEELIHARRLYSELGCPVIDVTRRSIEETAATILRLYQDREADVVSEQ